MTAADDASRGTGVTAPSATLHGMATGHHPDPRAEPAPAHPRRTWVLVTMALGFTMTMLDATIVAVALPTIQADLDLSNAERVWIVNAYLLVFTVSIAAAGKFADRLGQRRVFVVGLVIFTVASAGAGLAPNAAVLIAARAVEGFGGALMTPTSQSIVTNAYPVDERGRALGIYAGVSAVGVAAGPLLGGAFTTYLDWRAIFFVNVPVGIATYALLRYANPPQGRLARTAPIDWFGLTTLVVALSAIVVALMESSAWGMASAEFLGLMGVGVAALAAFVIWELRSHHPLLQLRIFADRNFTGDNLVTFAQRFSLFGMSVYGPIFVQDVLDFSAFEAGLATLPATIMLFLVSPRSGRLYDRHGARVLLTLGSLVAAGGFLWLAGVLPWQSYLWMVPAYVIVGIGVALIQSPALTDAMNAAPEDQRGEAAGVLGTVQQLGGTVGVAVITAVLSPLFTDRLADALGVSPGQVDAAMSEAQAEAGSGGITPANVPTALVDDAKDAFSSALSISFLVVVGLMLVAALIGFLVVRTRLPDPDAPSRTPIG